jgi:hypothetical protein
MSVCFNDILIVKDIFISFIRLTSFVFFTNKKYKVSLIYFPSRNLGCFLHPVKYTKGKKICLIILIQK